MRNLKNDEKGIAPLLLILGLVGLGLGGGVVFTIAPQMMMIYFLFAGFFLIGIIALKSGPKTLKLVVPVFVAVVVLVLIFSFIPMPWLTTVPPDFNNGETKIWREGDYEGRGNPSWSKELLDSIRYITSYKDAKKSENVVVSGGWCNKPSGGLHPIIGSYKYALFLWDGSSWVEEEARDINLEGNEGTPDADKCWYTPAEVFSIPSGYSGFARMRLSIYQERLVGAGWYGVAEDTAYVKEGIAEVEWSKTQYEVGETAKVHWRTGYCSSSKLHDPESGGCTVEIFSFGKGEVVLTQNVPQNDQGVISYLVTMADFDTGTGCENVLRADITNDLISLHEDDATVIDFSELAPSKPIIKTDKPSYTVGDPIEVTIEAKPNPDTKLPIEKYHIKVYYTDGAQVVMEDTWTESNIYISQATMEPGTIAIEVFCQDEGCRPSEIATKFVKVYAEGDIRGELPFPWMLLLLVLVMLFVGVLALLFLKIPFPLRIILFAILLVIPIGLYFMGVIY
jgi:hypothetical protein